MKKLGMLLVVLAMCLPAYGYILVYKLTESGTGVDFETDPNGWQLKKSSIRGYLVFDVNDKEPNVINDGRFITYYTEKTDHTTDKLYEIWTVAGGGEGLTQNILPGRPPKGKNIVSVMFYFSSGDGLGIASGADSIDGIGIELMGLLLGTTSSTDIGTLVDDVNKTKVDVAKSLKGSCWLGNYEHEALYEIGCGTLSAALDSKWTKTANNPDETKGFGGDIASFLDPSSGPSGEEPRPPWGLLNWLESTGYNPATD